MPAVVDKEGSADIRSEATLAEFTASCSDFMRLAVRVGLGGNVKPIAGGANYQIHVYVNSHLVVPDSTVSIAGGVTKAVASSKPFIVRDGDTIRVSAVGAGTDQSVDYSVVAYDVGEHSELLSSINDLLRSYTDEIMDRIGTARVIEVHQKEVVQMPEDLRR